MFVSAWVLIAQLSNNTHLGSEIGGAMMISTPPDASMMVVIVAAKGEATGTIIAM